MTEHAILSASGAHRWLHCTPSVQLEKQFPDKGSEYAAEGTLAHKLAELKLSKCFTKLKPSTYKKSYAEIKKDPLFKLEMDVYTDEYLEYVKDVYASFSYKPTLAVEQRLDFSHIVPDGFGTGDCIIVGGNKIVVIDFKYGQGVPVSAENNPQMMLYALGAVKAVEMLFSIESVKLSIFQPRLRNTSEWEVTTTELIAWGESIKPTAQSAFEGSGEYNAGDWCRFCKAKGLCRARTAFATAPYSESHGFLPPLISTEEASEYLKKADAIKKWANDLEEWALSEILAGGAVPGWKAVEGRSNRTFSDTDKAIAVALAAGYDEAILYERKPITLSAMEKLMGKAKFGETLHDLIIKPQGKPTLALESDNRPVYSNNITAAEAFSAEKEI